MNEYKWTMVDRIIYPILNSFALFGWLFAVWLEDCRWRFFITWCGSIVLTIMYGYYKNKSSQKGNKKLGDNNE